MVRHILKLLIAFTAGCLIYLVGILIYGFYQSWLSTIFQPGLCAGLSLLFLIAMLIAGLRLRFTAVNRGWLRTGLTATGVLVIWVNLLLFAHPLGQTELLPGPETGAPFGSIAVWSVIASFFLVIFSLMD